MNAQPSAPETPRKYGELYYSADDVRAILRLVSQLVEGDKRDFVRDLSSNLPSTMPWASNREDIQQSTGFSAICCDVLLRLEHVSVLGDSPLRLNALLRRGPIDQRLAHGQHAAGVADKQQDDPVERLRAELDCIKEALGVFNRS